MEEGGWVLKAEGREAWVAWWTSAIDKRGEMPVTSRHWAVGGSCGQQRGWGDQDLGTTL